MIIKRVMLLFGILFFSGMVLLSYAEDKDGPIEQMTHHKMMHTTNDGRISLGLSPEMKQHQLSNMRAHVEAVQAIVGFMAEGEFNKASQTAHSKLGLTEEMQAMCNMFSNDSFRDLGLAFHKSGDALGDVLETGNIKKSLHALNTTMGYCVRCHTIYRQ